MDRNTLLTVEEVSKMLRVGVQTIRRMCRAQLAEGYVRSNADIPFILIKRSYRFDPEMISEWLRAGGSHGRY